MHGSGGSSGAAAAGAPAIAGAANASSSGGAAPGGSGGMSGGAPAQGGAGAGGSAAGSGGVAQAGAGGAGGAPSGTGKQSWVWVWLDYKNSIATIAKNSKSFTHVSPALYTMNLGYTSPHLLNDGDDFSGLSSKQVADAVHAAGLKIIPLVYAGAGNNGTDQGIQAVLNDNPPGTQKKNIDDTVNECLAKGYDGFNLDWEPQGTSYDQYGAKLVTYLTALTAAFHAHNLITSFDAAGFYVRQCSNNGLVDMSKIGSSVDQMIMEDYPEKLGTPTQGCASPAPATANCSTFVGQLDSMCALPKAVVNIGMIAPYSATVGTNPFALDALKAVDTYGFTAVSLWPDSDKFIEEKNFQNGSDWYTALAAWLGKK